MRRNYVIAAVAALLLNGSAFANDMDMGKEHKFEMPKTRTENIERVKERLAELEKMSDADWNKHRDEMMKRREERHARYKAKHEASPAAGASTAATPEKK